jgi:hypothetical protein
MISLELLRSDLVKTTRLGLFLGLGKSRCHWKDSFLDPLVVYNELVKRKFQDLSVKT